MDRVQEAIRLLEASKTSKRGQRMRIASAIRVLIAHLADKPEEPHNSEVGDLRCTACGGYAAKFNRDAVLDLCPKCIKKMSPKRNGGRKANSAAQFQAESQEHLDRIDQHMVRVSEHMERKK